MTLTRTQHLLLDTFRTSTLSKKFYLTGGTALAYFYLKHRLSYDLDFFSDQPFSYEVLIPFITKLKQQLSLEKLEPVKIYDRWEFVIHTPELTRFEFVHYNHDKKRLAPLTEKEGLQIDSLKDIAANKVIAYLDRNEPKDTYDLYTLLVQNKFTVKKLLQLAEEKFGITISEFQFWSESPKSFPLLQSLVPYLTSIKESNIKEHIDQVKNFFLNQGKNYLEQSILKS